MGVGFDLWMNNPDIQIFELANANGMRVSLMDWGATIQSIKVPDRHGILADVVLGFDDPADYMADNHYFGSVVGRYANRIRKGEFQLDGKSYQLSQNHGEHHLHGGHEGLSHRIWAPKTIPGGVIFTIRSPDGDQGYPGNMNLEVTYILNDHNQLIITYRATTDQNTPINLTNHVYLNLNGHNAGEALDHHLCLNASYYLPVDDQIIPTGIIEPVEKSPFDFRQAKTIGQDIFAKGQQMQLTGGFDHCWVTDHAEKGRLRQAAMLYSPITGRQATVYTDQPGIQFYTGNFITPELQAKAGAVYGKYSGLCLETQHFPDSPNQTRFPSTILKPSEIFQSTTIYQFDVID